MLDNTSHPVLLSANQRCQEMCTLQGAGVLTKTTDAVRGVQETLPLHPVGWCLCDGSL